MNTFRTILFLVVWLGTEASASADAVALIQYDADRHYADYQRNMDALESLATEAVSAGATTIVLPEGSAQGYATAERLWCLPGRDDFQGRRCDDVSEVAEAVPGGASGVFWEAFARRHGVQVFYAVMERDGDSYFNTLAAVSAEGFEGKYRKRALYWVDEAYATPGSEPLVVTVSGQPFGVMICMDANYDSLYREYEDRGVKDVIASMDWDQSPQGQRAGRVFFKAQARRHAMNLFVSDQSAWDSTGYYPATGVERSRAPLAPVAPGIDGFVLQTLP